MKITVEFLDSQIVRGTEAVAAARDNLANAQGGLSVLKQLRELLGHPEAITEDTPMEPVMEH